jgi:hypothetical protein
MINYYNINNIYENEKINYASHFHFNALNQ